MANSVNTVALVGRLTRDAEVRQTQSGTSVANLPIAFNRSIKRGDEWEEKSCFVDATLWGRQAEALQPYLVKGKQVAIKGTLDFDTWEKEGQKRSKVYIQIDSQGGLELLGGNPNSNGGGSDPVQNTRTAFEDDVPF